MQLLNDKDWSQTISQITIKNPTAIFSIFSVNSDDMWQEAEIINIKKSVESEINIETWTNQNILNTWENLDPYDPEFEDEFNSFFWWEETEIENNTWEVIDENLENTEDLENTENLEKHKVWEALIKKFNE
jgi:hypothetical protein